MALSSGELAIVENFIVALWDKVVYNYTQVGQSGLNNFNHKSLTNKNIMLIGEFTHTLDDKKRITLPTKLRKELGKSVVVSPGIDSCLFLLTKSEWSKMSEKLSSGSMLEQNTRSFSRYLFGQAMEVDVDTAGRILVPENLRTMANLTGKVVLIGVKNRMEIWSEDSWNKYKKGIAGDVDTIAGTLGNLGVL
jgi:MraZ protein